MSKIILFIFAGREANLEVQRPFLDRLLDEYPQMEVHLWDLTRNADDGAYLNTRRADRVRVIHDLHSGHPIRCLYPNGRERRRGSPPCRCMRHKPPYEEPYKFYAGTGWEATTFVKMDDDVLFLETDRFGDLLAALDEHPDQVMSANVVNNVVCAKYELDLARVYEPLVGEPEDPENDKDWWALHESRHFARWSHDWFLANFEHLTNWRQNGTPFKTREGEAISINCIAFKYETMVRLADGFRQNSRLGDEGAVDALLPWIVPTFRAAHLSFGPQEAALGNDELQSYRDQYAAIGKEYLS